MSQWHQIQQSLFDMGIPVSEKVIRTVAVYLGLAVILRVAGKRNLGQFNTLDLVVILLVSNVVQNAIIGPDNSLVGGLLGAAVLIAVNAGLERFASSSDRMERVFEGTSTTVVEQGRYDDSALRRVGLRRSDLKAGLRRQGAPDVADVDEASIEPGGALVVTVMDERRPATRGDVAALSDALNARLDAVQSTLARLSP